MDITVFFLLVIRFSSILASNNGQEVGPENKLSFFALGDFGGIPVYPFFTPTQRRIAGLMGQIAELIGARFVVGLGDNFYYNGVKSVDDPRFKQTFDNVFTAPALYNTTWYMIAGNHDHHSNVSAQIAYSMRSRRWHFPNYYYTIVENIPGTVKTVQLVMIDTTLLCFKKADYLIVAGHHPVLSAGIHGNTNCLVSRLKPLLIKYDVTAYLSGHDHNLQHIKEDDSSVHYFVSGNGNFYSHLLLHRFSLPKNSLKTFYGFSGAFTLMEATVAVLCVTQLDEYGTRLYGACVKPRAKRERINYSMPRSFKTSWPFSQT